MMIMKKKWWVLGGAVLLGLGVVYALTRKPKLLNSDFATNIDNWIIDQGEWMEEQKGISQAEWSSEHDGSLHTHIDGSPAVISSYQPTQAQIPAGKTIRWTFYTSGLGRPGWEFSHISFIIGYKDDNDLIVVGGAEYPEGEYVVDLITTKGWPAGTPLGFVNPVWPGNVDIYFYDVQII